MAKINLTNKKNWKGLDTKESTLCPCCGKPYIKITNDKKKLVRCCDSADKIRDNMDKFWNRELKSNI